MKAVLGLTVFLTTCALTSMIAEWLAEHAPGWMWIPLFMAIPTGMLIWIGREYYATIKRKKKEGDRR